MDLEEKTIIRITEDNSKMFRIAPFSDEIGAMDKAELTQLIGIFEVLKTEVLGRIFEIERDT